MKIMNFRARDISPCVLYKAFLTGMLMSVWVVQAAGLGKLTVSSYLGQPLKAEIALESVTDKEINTLSARLASPKIFQKAGINLAPYHATLSVAVEKRTDGQPYVRVVSSQAISEPFLKLLIELHSSSGRMLREYNVLLDPADTRKPATAPPVIQSAGNQAEDSAATAAGETQPFVKAERQSSVSQEKSAVQTGNTYGPVMQGDTLSRIARQVSPDSVSLNHMLVALYRANRDAFLEKNMNLLKVGVILRIPDEEEISSITVKEAAREVAVQKESWNSYRQRIADLAGDAPGKNELKQSQSGKIITVSEDTSVAGSGKPEEVLILSKGELLDDSHSSVKSAESKTAQNYLHMMEEDAIAKERALREANERVAILEQNVAKLQRLLELKEEASGNKGQAELDQAQHVSDLQPVPVITDQTGTVAETSESAAQTPEKSALPVTIPVQPVNPVSSAKSLQPADPVSEEPALMDTLVESAMENSEWVVGGLATLLTIALGASVVRRRRAQTEDLNAEDDLYDFNEKDNGSGTSVMAEAMPSGSENPESSESVIGSAQQAAGPIMMENSSSTDDHTDVDPGLFFGSRQDERVTEDSFLDDSASQIQEEEDATFNELDELGYEIKIDTEEPDQTEYKQEAVVETGENDKDDIGEQWIFTATDTGLERKPDSVQQQDTVEEFVSLHDEHQIDFDLDLPVDTEAQESESRVKDELSDLGSSLANIDLDLGDKPDTKFQSGEYSEAEEMQWQEVATKLDLAKAYLEMDDRDGAREILEEVLREGDDEQQSTARSMLDQIS